LTKYYGGITLKIGGNNMTRTITTTTTLEIGSVFCSSWGYDQTNVDFYEVVGFTSTGRSVRLRKIGQDTDETGFMCGETTAVPGIYTGEVFTKRIIGATFPKAPSVKIHSHAWAWLMEDPTKSERCSWYA
jgi:hypothetical protein